MKTKFRLWDKRFSEFVEDFLVSEDGKIYKKSTDTGYGIAISRETSDKVILMQSTGILDKNSQEIFEGDIISDGHTSRDIRHHQTFGFYTINDNGDEEFFGDTASLEDFEEFSKYMSENIEIIGNIYENPELLEDSE